MIKTNEDRFFIVAKGDQHGFSYEYIAIHCKVDECEWYKDYKADGFANIINLNPSEFKEYWDRHKKIHLLTIEEMSFMRRMNLLSRENIIKERRRRKTIIGT